VACWGSLIPYGGGRVGRVGYYCGGGDSTFIVSENQGDAFVSGVLANTIHHVNPALTKNHTRAKIAKNAIILTLPERGYKYHT
jgi:hypothetical protein